MLDLGVDVVLQVLNVGDESHAGREQKTHHKDELHGEVRVGWDGMGYTVGTDANTDRAMQYFINRFLFVKNIL